MVRPFNKNKDPECEEEGENEEHDTANSDETNEDTGISSVNNLEDLTQQHLVPEQEKEQRPKSPTTMT